MRSKWWQSTALRWIISLVMLVMIYAGVDVIITGAQHLFHKEDHSTLEQMIAELESESAIIGTMELQLTEQDNDVKEWNVEMNQETDEDQHAILVVQYNEKVEVYNLLYNQYDSKITAYNHKVNEAKALSEKIGGTWYISPIRIRN